MFVKTTLSQGTQPWTETQKKNQNLLEQDPRIRFWIRISGKLFSKDSCNKIFLILYLLKYPLVYLPLSCGVYVSLSPSIGMGLWMLWTIGTVGVTCDFQDWVVKGVAVCDLFSGAFAFGSLEPLFQTNSGEAAMLCRSHAAWASWGRGAGGQSYSSSHARSDIWVKSDPDNSDLEGNPPKFSAI